MTTRASARVIRLLAFLPLTAGVGLGLVACPAAATPTSSASTGAGSTQLGAPSRADLWVDPRSPSSGEAYGSPAHPLRSIQAALDRARPGTTVHLAPGTYHERPTTRVDGTTAAPITIEGPETGTDVAGRYQATLYGTGRIFRIRNNHYTLRGFTIDGQEAIEQHVPLAQWPTDPSQAQAFKRSVRAYSRDGRLIYAANNGRKPVTGTIVEDMFLSGGGGECVRLRQGARANTIRDSVVQWCGLYPSTSTSGGQYHNGEGIYIGTSPKSTTLAMHSNDPASRNSVLRTTVRTFGSECVDIKENAHDNLVAGVMCSDNLEPVANGGSGIEVRGYANTIRDTTITASAGHGVKIAADPGNHVSEGNSVIDVHVTDVAGAVLSIQSPSAQGAICGNTAPEQATGLRAAYSASCS